MLTVSLDCLSSSCIVCAQCWHCLSSVYLHPVSSVPNVDIVSRLFIFILYLVYPSWQCLSIVYLHPVSCVPNVDSVSRLFVFILYLVYPMLTLSLECLSSSCILCTQCWHCLSSVYLHPVSCVPNVDIVLSIVYLHPVSCVPNVDIVSRLFIFILYLVSQCWQCLSIVCLHPVSCVPNVDIVSRLFIFILYLVCLMFTVFSSVYLHPVSCVPMLTVSLECLSSSCILCAQCWQCLSIVCLHPVSCVPNVDIVSRLFIFILYLVYPMLTLSLDCLSSSCILCTQCWHVSRLFIFILYLVYPMLTVSLDCLSSSCILCNQCWQCLSIVYLHPVSCVPNVDIVSRVFIFILYLLCPMLTLSLDCLSSSCILCTQCWQCLLDCFSSSCILCTQCWQRLSIVCLHLVSCVPNVDSVSRLFIFILYLVCPMLTLSLECLSSSCILCAQCWHCLSSVYLHPVSCVPNVDSVSRLFIFILYLVYPMLTVSLDCLSSSCILCTQCWHCLSIVYLHPVSCVPNVDSVSRLFIFILYLVYPMLTVSLDCLSSSCIFCTQCWHCLSIVYLHHVSCVPNVDSVSRLFIFILYLVCLMLTLSLDCLSSSCILCPNVDSVLSIVYLHPVSCVPNVDSVSGVFIFILYLVYPMLTVSLDGLSSSCILCAQCWQCLSIVCLHPVTCVPNVDIVSRLFIFILYLVYPMLTVSLDCLFSSCILCAQCWHCLSNYLSSSCILCAQCWHCLSIVYLHPVSCVPNVDSVSRVFVFILYLVYPMLTLSLDYLSSSCILCAQCWHCLSSVYLHPVSCVPNVDIVSRLFIFILYLVYPMLTVSLDCLSSSCILCTQCDSVSRLLSSSCILCAQCWHCLSIVCLHPVSCVPNVDSVSRLFIFILYLVYPMLTVSLDCLSSSCILCAQCWHCLSSVYLHPCILCAQCWQCLSIIYLHPCILCTQYWQCLSIVYLHPVSFVPNVDIVSRLFIFILYLVCPMLTLSLECLSSSCILCAECCQCLSIVYLHPVSCVPNVDIVSRIVIFILYLVYPMLTVSLDCLSSSCILCA